ncbi:MAG: formylglycine-generating enzyme family protein [Candidatus Brocadiaceae bacterium]|nr:formylglycine-generating enzyme family protein [Candidatus Brocadiaceae bacterium]
MRKHLLYILIISLALFESVIILAEEINVPTTTDTLTGMEFVYIKGGCFDMGDTFGVGYDDETPVHEACVNDFYIAKYEVTVAEFKMFVTDTGYKTDAEKEGFGKTINNDANKLIDKEGANWRNPGFFQNNKHPVVLVSWDDAEAYIKWLNNKTGMEYRLPTEAEWEYAARSGGKQYKYSWGNGNPHGIITSGQLSSELYPKFQIWDGDDEYIYSAPVGSSKANELGIYDMTGNISEWCSDWYGEEYYSVSDKHNPKGPTQGSSKVFRGGSCHCQPRYPRASLRLFRTPSYRYYYLGFRLARNGSGLTNK